MTWVGLTLCISEQRRRSQHLFVDASVKFIVDDICDPARLIGFHIGVHHSLKNLFPPHMSELHPGNFEIIKRHFVFAKSLSHGTIYDPVRGVIWRPLNYRFVLPVLLTNFAGADEIVVNVRGTINLLFGEHIVVVVVVPVDVSWVPFLEDLEVFKARRRRWCGGKEEIAHALIVRARVVDHSERLGRRFATE